MTVQITGHPPHGSLLELEPRAPFRLDLTTWALRRRPHNAIDRWDASTYGAWCASKVAQSRSR